MGPVSMAMRSPTAGERDLVVGVFGPEVADGHLGTGEVEEEVDPFLAAELGRLARRQPAQLVELGREQKCGIRQEFRGGQPEVEEEIVAIRAIVRVRIMLPP